MVELTWLQGSYLLGECLLYTTQRAILSTFRSNGLSRLDPVRWDSGYESVMAFPDGAVAVCMAQYLCKLPLSVSSPGISVI